MNKLGRFTVEVFDRMVPVIGLALLVAAVTKSIALMDSIWLFGDSTGRPLNSSVIFAALIPVEVYVGVELVVGRQARRVLMLGIGLMVAFAAFSAWQLLVGVGSCGCFGRVSTAPSLKMLVCTSALIPLLCSFYWNKDWRDNVAWPYVSTTILRSVLFLSVLAILYFSTTESSLRSGLSGQKLVAQPVGEFQATSDTPWTQADIPVRNITDSPVEVVGASRACGVFVDEDFPLTVAPGKTVSIAIRAKNPTNSRILEVEFLLFRRTAMGTTRQCKFSIPLMRAK